MAGELYSPTGPRISWGMTKDGAFGAFQTPTIFIPGSKWSGPMNTTAPPRSPRASMGATYPGTGGRSATGSLDFESQPDTLGALLLAALGAQTTPSATIVNTTVGTGGSTIGATTIPVTSTKNIFKGMTLTIDTSGNQETLVVATVGLNSFTTTTPATKAHTAGVTVTCTSSSAAYASTMTLGTPLPTYSVEVNRPGGISTDYTGCKVNTLSLAISQKGVLTPKVGWVIRDRVTQASPTTPSFSSKQPIAFEQQFAAPILLGSAVASGAGAALSVGSEATVMGVNLSLSNNIKADNFALGAGNLVRNWPEGGRSLSGSLSMGFESATLRNAFEAARTGGALPSCSLLIPLCGTDLADPTLGVPFGVSIYLPKIFLSQDDSNDDFGQANISQSIQFTGHDSVPGANDMMTVYYIGTNSAVF